MNVWLARFVLAALVIVIFSQTAWHDFVDYDDPLVITRNPDIQKVSDPKGWRGHLRRIILPIGCL